VGEDHIHQPYDRRFAAGFNRFFQAQLRFFFRDFDRAGVLAVSGDFLDNLLKLDFLVSAVIALDGVAYGPLRRDDRLDVQSRHELQIVDGEYVGWVRCGDSQGRANPTHRHHAVFGGQLDWYQADDGRIDLEDSQIDGRQPVLAT